MKNMIEDTTHYIIEYLQYVKDRSHYPTDSSLQALSVFNEHLPIEVTDENEVLKQLHDISVDTTVHYGAKYFGFVNGGILPIGLAAKMLSSAWNQNTALYTMSPISAKLEEVCEQWIIELFELNLDSSVSFISGTSTANLSAIAIARNELLHRLGYDVQKEGIYNVPKIRIVINKECHSSVYKALSILGYGTNDIELIETTKNGDIDITKIPILDEKTIVILQAGNVNGGAYDDIDTICKLANSARSWVHIDGAFGLWAAASTKYKHLVRGIDKVDSMAMDAHKTLNAPYDNGMLICKNKSAVIRTFASSGSYLNFGQNRDSMQYNIEMSKQSRAVEIWAIIKSLGRNGIENLINTLCDNTTYFAEQLKKHNYIILREVVFNQIVFKCETNEKTSILLQKIQESNVCWTSGTIINDENCIRVSVCSWETTKKDIDECIELFNELRN